MEESEERKEKGRIEEGKEGRREGGKEGRREGGKEFYHISLGEVGTCISCPLCCVVGQMLLTANERLEGFCDGLALADRSICEVQ